MEEAESSFNKYVSEQAKALLSEIKSNTSTYKEAMRELEIQKKSIVWSSPKKHYLVVIEEAKLQLEKEIDAITLK